jgi:hypothetical protein
MYQRYFPPCPVDGPIDPPVPFGHLGLHGAVPQKCSHCEHLFEGECLRSIDEVGGYLHLDHGPCGVNGPTDPVFFEKEFIASKVSIPRKCAECIHLSVGPIRGFHCTKDADKWGDSCRGLDWGAWRPDHVYIQLDLPKVTTKALSEYAFAGDEVAFIREHRRINPGLSLQEAKQDYAYFRSVVEKCETPASGDEEAAD